MWCVCVHHVTFDILIQLLFVLRYPNIHFRKLFCQSIMLLKQAWSDPTAAEKLKLLKEFNKLSKVTERRAVNMLNVKHGFFNCWCKTRPR